MATKFEFKMDARQAKAIGDSLDRLSTGSARHRVVRGANNKAMRPVRKVAKGNLSKYVKPLAKTMDLITKTYKGSGAVVTIVGANKKHAIFQEKNYPTNVLELIEYGVQPHTIVAGKSKYSSKTKTYRGKTKTVQPKGDVPSVLSNINEGGDEIFGPDVHHPGTPPRPFMRPAFESTKNSTVAIWGQAVGEGITREFAKGLKK